MQFTTKRRVGKKEKGTGCLNEKERGYRDAYGTHVCLSVSVQEAKLQEHMANVRRQTDTNAHLPSSSSSFLITPYLTLPYPLLYLSLHLLLSLEQQLRKKEELKSRPLTLGALSSLGRSPSSE